MNRVRVAYTNRRAALFVAFAALSSLAMAGCAQCASSELAELTAGQGAVERDFSTKQEAWQHAKEGAVFGLGDGLRTGKGARAELALRPSGRARVEEHTVLRFLNEKPEDGVELMQVEEGTVEIDSAAVEITLRVGDEVARIAQRSRVRIRAASANEAALDVIVGRVQIAHGVSHNAGQPAGTETVLAGNSISLGVIDEVHGASEKALQTEASANAKTALEHEPASDRTIDVEAETGTVVARSNERADVVLPRLERATFHVAKLPLSLAIPMAPCDGELRVRVSSKGHRRDVSAPAQQTSILVDLNAGTHKLAVRCGKKEISATSIRIVRDAGTLELPRSAPKIDVAADGRRYTVKYQNLLPSVSFSWPNAPPGPYTLSVARKGKTQLTRPSARPRIDFSSGELSEGEHTFSFQSPGQKAKPTIVRIAFDDSARVGFLSSPSDGASASDRVLVSGGSLLRAQVSIEGQPVELDSHGRFSANVPHSPHQNAISIRMSHPSTGVHYYIRRLDAAVR